MSVTTYAERCVSKSAATIGKKGLFREDSSDVSSCSLEVRRNAVQKIGQMSYLLTGGKGRDSVQRTEQTLVDRKDPPRRTKQI